MRTILIAVAAALLLPSVSFAHGGGLDSNGGHYNRKTGVYHCHREPCFSNQKKINEQATPAKAKVPSPTKKKQEEAEKKTGPQ